MGGRAESLEQAAVFARIGECSPAIGNVLANGSDVDNTLAVASFQVAGDTTTYLAGATATIAGETVFATTEWAEPDPTFFDPPRSVGGGDPLHFECTFVNNSSQPLYFGESAENNEMCIFAASFYPVPEGQVTVGCN